MPDFGFNGITGRLDLVGDDRLNLTSPNGHLWSISVGDDGALTAVDITPIAQSPRRSSLWFLMPYISST